MAAVAAQPWLKGMGTTVVAGLLNEKILVARPRRRQPRVPLPRRTALAPDGRPLLGPRAGGRRDPDGGRSEVPPAEERRDARARGRAVRRAGPPGARRSRPGDRYLFCSDGLTTMLSDEEIGEAPAAETDPEKLCQKLVEQANEKGGVDNITVVRRPRAPTAAAPTPATRELGRRRVCELELTAPSGPVYPQRQTPMRPTRKERMRAAGGLRLLCLAGLGYRPSRGAAAEPVAAGAGARAAGQSSPFRSFGSARASARRPGPSLRRSRQTPALAALVGGGAAAAFAPSSSRSRAGCSPFSDGEPLRVYVAARRKRGGVARLAVRAVDRRPPRRRPRSRSTRSVSPTARSSTQVARLFALAVLDGLRRPDAHLLQRRCRRLPRRPSGDAIPAATRRWSPPRRPELDLARAPRTRSGGSSSRSSSRAAGDRRRCATAWERARADGRGHSARLLSARGLRDERGARRGASCCALRRDSTPPSRRSRARRASGSRICSRARFDAARRPPSPIRHRTFWPAIDARALRVAWPDGGGSGRGGRPLPGRRSFRRTSCSWTPGDDADDPALGRGARRLGRPGRQRRGAARRRPSSSASRSFRSRASGRQAVRRPTARRSRVTTGSHERLAGWALFREQLLPDGRIARTGPQIVPSTHRGRRSRSATPISTRSAAPGTWYRYTVWAVTEDGLLARAFSSHPQDSRVRFP